MGDGRRDGRLSAKRSGPTGAFRLSEAPELFQFPPKKLGTLFGEGRFDCTPLAVSSSPTPLIAASPGRKRLGLFICGKRRCSARRHLGEVDATSGAAQCCGFSIRMASIVQLS
jgi:hypothetical protein